MQVERRITTMAARHVPSWGLLWAVLLLLGMNLSSHGHGAEAASLNKSPHAPSDFDKAAVNHKLAPRRMMQERRLQSQPLIYKGNTAWPYGRCEGDCDADADCSPGLKCFQRSGFTSVPGCSSGGSGDREDVDYCAGSPTNSDNEEVEKVEIEDVAGDLDDDELLGKCEGDCDDDDECAENLVCFQRDADEPVPGCGGSPQSGWDYCIRQSDLEKLEEELEEEEEEWMEELNETDEPTKRPTMPAMPQAGTVFTYPDGEEPDDMKRCFGDCDKGE